MICFIDLVKLANENEGFVMAMLATASFMATIVAIILSRAANKLSEKNISQTLEIERERSRPYIIFDIEHRKSLIFAVLRNIGQTGAHNVSVKIEPELEEISSNRNRKSSLTTKTISFVAPGREISDFISAGHVFYKQYGSPIFTGKISYQDSVGKHYEEKLVLDLNSLKELVVIVTPDIPEEMKKLVKEMHDLAGIAKRIHRHMTRDLGETNGPESSESSQE